MATAPTESAAVHPVFRSDEQVTLHVIGKWQMEATIPEVEPIWEQVQSKSVQQISFEAEQLISWDSSILTFLVDLADRCQKKGLAMQTDGLPAGVQQLLSLARAVPKQENTKSSAPAQSFLDRVGEEAICFIRSTGELLTFIGATSLAFGSMLRGRAKFRPYDFKLFLEETGANAVPIISLISFLFGLILAFVGIMQLELFGAQIYVADLVAIAMVRVMGAVVVGIIMAGRTGAAFAAQLGTMQVNEEIDALKTLAISPVEFLVLPRMLALTLMMPFLTLYADLMGILGGALIGCTVYGINPVVFFNRVTTAVSLNDLFIGLFMGLVFGILVALSGCLRGIQCGRNASAVGDAATSAVVTSLVAIIIATAVIIMICAVLGI
jgi:phospholipid/cholesterol/gamma-HCH transport system permease protein